jgi:competence protein ComEC
MAAGSLALAGGGLVAVGAPEPLATILGLPAWAALTAMIVVVRAAAALPFASVTLTPPFNLLAAAAAGGGVAIVVLGRRRRWPRIAFGRPTGSRVPPRARQEPGAMSAGARRGPGIRRGHRSVGRPTRLLVGLLMVVVVGIAAVALTRPDGRVRISVLDVGQGDAILVDADRGARMLVDGGPDPDRLLVALDAHVPAWDRRIDLLVLTHPHEDHVAGMALLLQRYRVSRVVEPGMRGPGPGYRAWAAELAAEGRSAGRLASGDSFAIDDVRFDVLWPDRGSVPAEPGDTGTGINNVSIVLLGTFGQERFILAGDIEEGIDPTLLARGLPRVDFLKVAHHGSRTSSTGAFLDAVRPRIAAVSVGAGNTYGHPAPATIDRLRQRKAEVFRTDLDGTVVVTLDGTAASAHAEGGRRRAASASATVAASFRCGIPLPFGRRVGTQASPPVSVATPWPAGPGPADPGAGARLEPPAAAALYHRLDDGSRAGRRRRPPPLPRSPALGAAPCVRGRRGRGLACRPDRSPRGSGRSRDRGGGRPAP